MSKHNDDERRLWVLNDEGLYNMQVSSRKPVRDWTRENRTFIDEAIDNVVSGKKQAHYLRYG